jgi:hypothetical protein
MPGSIGGPQAHVHSKRINEQIAVYNSVCHVYSSVMNARAVWLTLLSALIGFLTGVYVAIRVDSTCNLNPQFDRFTLLWAMTS